MSNKIKGKYGEDIAVKYLIKNGYKIVERNYHFSRYGEIDIIALDKDTLCFIEVKTRTTEKFGTGFEAVNRTKLSKIYKCALSYLSIAKIPYKNYRIEVVSILLTANETDKEPKITHIKNVEFS